MKQRLRKQVRYLQWLLPGFAIAIAINLWSGEAFEAPKVEADKDCVQFASDFTDYALVFPGETVTLTTQGGGSVELPILGCQRIVTQEKYAKDGSVREPAMDYVVFLYGSCEPSGEDQSCAPPVQVISDPACAPVLSVESIAERGRARGVEVAIKHDASVRVETPGFKATVWALDEDYDTSKNKALQVVNTLRGANRLAADLEVGKPLDTPVQGGPGC